jgi:hypothetical protein
MKKITPFLLLIPVSLIGRAQDETEKKPSAASQAYHESRQKTTTPPYGLEKIQSLLPKMKDVPDKDGSDEGTEALTEKTYTSLSLPEKFTYNMVHGESYFQSCYAFLPYLDEEKKIFARLPPLFGDQGWSKRQKNFFLDNKDSVILLMTAGINRTHYVGLNYKHVIVDVNATSMIPLLIDIYKLKRKDHDILTVLLLLMLNNSYPPFVSSTSHHKLYASEGSSYSAYLIGNTANQDLIIQRATEFYDGLKSIK